MKPAAQTIFAAVALGVSVLAPALLLSVPSGFEPIGVPPAFKRAVELVLPVGRTIEEHHASPVSRPEPTVEPLRAGGVGRPTPTAGSSRRETAPPPHVTAPARPPASPPVVPPSAPPPVAEPSPPTVSEQPAAPASKPAPSALSRKRQDKASRGLQGESGKEAKVPPARASHRPAKAAAKGQGGASTPADKDVAKGDEAQPGGAGRAAAPGRSGRRTKGLPQAGQPKEQNTSENVVEPQDRAGKPDHPEPKAEGGKHG